MVAAAPGSSPSCRKGLAWSTAAPPDCSRGFAEVQAVPRREPEPCAQYRCHPDPPHFLHVSEISPLPSHLAQVALKMPVP